MYSDSDAKTGRVSVDMNGAWNFICEDIEGAQAPGFDDSAWKTVQVPHDWSVESSFDEKWEGATGYLPGGIGWYRKTFKAPESVVSFTQFDGVYNTEKPKKQIQRVAAYLHFDGIYNNSTIYLNGEKLGDHPYGYSPFFYDVSGKLKDGENVLAVRVDHSRYCDSRWYTGGGIYRSVELVCAAETHIPLWGTFITTPEITDEKAVVKLEANVNGPVDGAELTTVILDPAGNKVAEISSAATNKVEQTLEVADPKLWDIENPNLYKAVSTIMKDGTAIDEYTTVFGIRTIKFDADTGFFLNGKHTYIKGVCLHHDAGCVGSAVPRDVWRRRFETLKSGGVNAIRVAHNPASSEFLELCDELGILVQDEFFDEWDNPKDKRMNMNEQHDDYISRSYTEHFQEWAERDLKDVMLSHRNHPSIIQWSIGNEIEWTYPRNAEATGFFDASWDGNYFWSKPPHSREEIIEQLKTLPRGKYDVGETAQKLSRWTKELDTSRPVTANCILPSASYESGYADALDVIGFSYRRVMYDYGHKIRPDLPLMGAENLGQWHEWKAIKERPFIAGTYLWTGIDYMGEVNEQWPKNTLDSGLLDRAGFEKGSFHMMKTMWNDEPHVHLTTQTLEKSPYIFDEATGFIGEEDADAWKQKLWLWHDVNTHWNYEEGEMVAVEVYSNCESVELFLNGESLGKKNLADFDDRIYKWAVPFKPGKLEAKAVSAADEMESAGTVAGVDLTVDGCHVIAQLVDEAGVPVKASEQEIVFEVSGAGRILGVDNGSPFSTQDYQSDRVTTSQGRCLLVLDVEDEMQVTATSGDLKSKTVKVVAVN